MTYSTLGIIGHVDHGKTSLVKALTGIDTDRLKEEKERGISITLGYSHLELPNGELGIIDAPGHEKFIRTMVAGATASDLVLLVVDINEGVKPQTIEHLDIAQLLNIRRGVIAVTKCDAGEEDMRELVVEEIRDLTAGTFLETAPIVFTSAVSGEGLDELKETLSGFLDETTPLKDEGLFYLPIDRVFTMSGHGTVVTGTLRRGTLAIGAQVQIYPRTIDAVVRSLQSHNATVESIAPGHRCAVNLRGVEKATLEHGDVLATPGSTTPTRFLDVEFRLLDTAEKAVKHNQVVRLLFGTKEIFARFHLLDRDVLEPGERCVCQLKLEDEIAALNGEPYIVRTYSPMLTIGGGTLLAASRGRHKRRNEAALNRLTTLASGSLADILEQETLAAQREALDLKSFAMDRRVTLDEVKAIVAGASTVMIDETHAVHDTVYMNTRNEILDSLRAFHTENRTVRGMTRAQLSGVMGLDPDALLLSSLIDSLQDKDIGIEKGLIHLADFDPSGALSASDKTIAEELESAFKNAGLASPNVQDLLQGDKQRIKIFHYLVEGGVLTPLTAPSRNKNTKNNIAFHHDSLDELKGRLMQQFGTDTPFPTSAAKEILGISRKFLIPLLEYLDSSGFTRRAGEERIIRG